MSSTIEDIKAWKRSRRLEAVERRVAVPDARREAWDLRIRSHVDSVLAAVDTGVVAFCWPYKGELDLREVMSAVRSRGARLALPEVVAPRTPLEFREWWPGAAMAPGVYDIPVPQGTARLLPDIALLPMNGFDEQGFRLGYGGGFFDRTLAAIRPAPIAVGIAYEMLRMDSIHPNEHDIAMDFIVTEAGIYARRGAALEPVPAEASSQRLQELAATRSLPRPL